MSKIIITASENSITNQDITDFEKNAGVQLPQNFKKFILKFNGGLAEDHDNVNTFYSIKYGEIRIEDYIQVHQNWEKNLPEEYLPIGGDWSDNPITIGLSGENEGKIVQFYFDTDREPEVIANSLEELLGVESIDDL